MTKKFAAIALASIAATHSANAQVFDEKTKCAVVSEILDAPSPDTAKVLALFVHVEQVMKAADSSHKSKVFPRLNEKGRKMLVATVTTRCRSEPEKTIYDVIFENYDGFRGLYEMMEGK